MKHPVRFVVRAICAAALAPAIFGTAQAAVCGNVVFKLTNVSDGPILVSKVRYRDLDSGDPNKLWVENVKDTQCPAWSEPCEIPPENLGSATRPRENHELTDIQFLHAHEDAYGDWMKAVWSTKNVPDNPTCTDNRTYGPYDVN